MATTRKRSSASASISKSAIESARSNLNELSEKPKENLSLREAIGELHESITAALDRGYSYEEVVEILSTQGVTITVASLKRYLASARKEVSDKPKRTRRTSTRSRSTQLAKQAEELSGAATPDEATQEAAETTADATPTETARKRRTTSRTKTAAKSATKPAAKSTTRSAAKSKPTSTAKTTSRSTAGRGRKRSSASE
jgi:type IV secretory pathway VirJ component